MNKSFSVEDIRKVRDQFYEQTKHMSEAEASEEIRKGAQAFRSRIALVGKKTPEHQ